MATLLQSSKGFQPGSPVEVALRLRMDEGWHTYWVNPGESGIPISVEWNLPEGWVAGPLLHPVPERFTAGDLAGFGYSGEVVIPVFLTAGEESGGEVTVKAEVSWLNCDDARCVPGEAVLEATWVEGITGAGEHADTIAAALERVPQPLEGAVLEVEPGDKSMRLNLTLPGALDPSRCEVFPVTADVIDAGDRIEFERHDKGWRAEVGVGEYASGPVRDLELVLAGEGLTGPLRVAWHEEDAE